MTKCRFSACAVAISLFALSLHAQPTFTLAAAPTSLYANEHGIASTTITVQAANGFAGPVLLSASGLPEGVSAHFGSRITKSDSSLLFEAAKVAATGVFPVTVSGVSGSLTASVTINLAVSAAIGTGGSGTQVDLSSVFNVYGIYTNGTPFDTGGLDGVGWAFSANLLTGFRNYDGIQFYFGPPNELDAVSGTGQPIPLPQGNFAHLLILGNGVEGDQIDQLITVTYTDGTSSRYVRSFSDWYTPQDYPGEYKAVIMPYRCEADGGEDNRGNFYLYGYPFILDSSKTVASLTLPDNRDLTMLAVTLTVD